MSEATAREVFVCAQCGKRYLIVAEAPARDPRCPSDASALQIFALPLGVYELAPHRLSPEIEGRVSNANLQPERDLGFGASHGYAPGHGGPAGPGDAPASDRDKSDGDAKVGQGSGGPKPSRD